MFKRLFFIVFLINLSSVFALEINEVMYDPNCPDIHCEYIELHNNDVNSLNVTNLRISDGSEDILEDFNGENNFIIPGNSYVLIVDEDSRLYHYFDIPDVLWLYTDDNAVGNGLSVNENIELILDGNIIDSVNYSGSGNGKSYSKINNNWELKDASPGKENNNVIFTTKSISNIIISEFMPNPKGDDRDMEWIELYNPGDDIDLLGFELKDEVGDNPDIIISETNTNGSTIIKSKDYLVVYGNLLNNEGFEKIRLYDLNDNLIDETTYFDSSEDMSWSLVNEKWYLTVPTPNNENNYNKEDVSSRIEIEEIYDIENGLANWGDSIRVRVNIYKGDTDEEVIWLWVENFNGGVLDKKYRFTVDDKFTNNTITYPIQIPEGCGYEKIRLVVEGFDVNDKEIINVKGEECNILKETVKVESESVKNDTYSVTNKLVYENESVKIQRSAVFMFAGLMTSLSVYSVFRKWK